jgi:pimeloyl-ACP methyl ester carboxylesterase
VRTSSAFPIGGIPQWLYIHRAPGARDTLLFLHGGPGWSDAPLAHLACEDLWSHFNIVHWDQAGSNRSYHPSLRPSDLSVGRLVNDGLEVAALLRREFGFDRIFLVGHSWGSMLGVLMARAAPQAFAGYVGIGQLVANTISEPLSLELCRERARSLGRDDLLLELAAYGPDFYHDLESLYRQRRIAAELGGEFAQPVTDEEFEAWLDEAPKAYYTTSQALNDTCEFSMGPLWPELTRIDLRREATELELPVLVLSGAHDFFTPGSVAEEWCRRLRAPQKHFVLFEQSAHWPQIEQHAEFARILRSWVNAGAPSLS